MASQQCLYPEISENTGPNRRLLFQNALAGFASIIAASLGIPAVRYLSFSPEKSASPKWIFIGRVDQIVRTAPAPVIFERTASDGWKTVREPASAWVVPSASGTPVVFAPTCTHLGCAYRWDTAKDVFVCPCHGSTFAKDGRVLSGPATRPLDRYQVRVQDGSVLVARIEPA